VSLHDSHHEGAVRNSVALSCELRLFIYLIRLRGTIFPDQECNNDNKHVYVVSHTTTKLLRDSYLQLQDGYVPLIRQFLKTFNTYLHSISYTAPVWRILYVLQCA